MKKLKDLLTAKGFKALDYIDEATNDTNLTAAINP